MPVKDFSKEDIEAFKSIGTDPDLREASERAVLRRKQWEKDHPFSPIEYLQWLNSMHRLCQVRPPRQKKKEFNSSI